MIGHQNPTNESEANYREGIRNALNPTNKSEANYREGIRNALKRNEIRSSSSWPENQLTALEERGIHRRQTGSQRESMLSAD